MNLSRLKPAVFVFALVAFYVSCPVAADEEASAQLVSNGIFADPDSSPPEISTNELQQIISDGSAIVLDTRPHLEWSISHIPTALNVAPKPGVPMALYTSDVAEVGRLVNGDKARAVVLYCNGPYCGKSKRVAGELLKAGYTNVRRYQLGAPIWRALVGVMVIEPDGIRYVFEKDKSAVWIDTRDASEFGQGSVPGASNLPRSAVLPGKDVGEVFAAKNDGRLPMEDHNTRIVVFGQNETQAREVAEAIAREAFHNVSYFSGKYDQVAALVE